MSVILPLLNDLNTISKEINEMGCLLQTEDIEQIIYREVKRDENNARLFLSLLDEMNTLYETLNRLNYVIQRKKMELNVLNKGMEEK